MARMLMVKPQHGESTAGFLQIPEGDLDPFETYPIEKIPKPRGRRGSLQRTEPELALSIDFDPLTSDRGSKDVPQVIVETALEDTASSSSSSSRLSLGSNTVLTGLNTSSARDDMMPDVSVHAAPIIAGTFKSKKKGSRSCFPITLKQKKIVQQAKKDPENRPALRVLNNESTKNEVLPSEKRIPVKIPADCSDEQHNGEVDETMENNMIQNCHVHKMAPECKRSPGKMTETNLKRRSLVGADAQREESRLMKQRQRLLTLKSEVDDMEEEVTERETRLINWQERLDAQELCLQEREAIVSRRQHELDRVDTELTNMCKELDENKEKLRAEGRTDQVAKLNWNFLRKAMMDKQYALEAALRSYKMDLVNKEARLRENHSHVELCQAKIYTMENELERRARRILQLEHIITAAMRHRPLHTRSSSTSSSTPKIVINDCSGGGGHAMAGTNAAASSSSRNSSRSASINSIGSESAYSRRSSIKLGEHIANSSGVTGHGSLIAGPADAAKSAPAVPSFTQEKFISQTCTVM